MSGSAQTAAKGLSTDYSQHGVGEGPQVRFEYTDTSGHSAAFADWTRLRISRSLHELAGSFELEYDDRVRGAAVRGRAAPAGRMALQRIDILRPVAIYIDDELVLKGFVEGVDFSVTGAEVRASLHGLDLAGDILECSANPEGPAEYKGLNVLQIVTRLATPFGIKVRAEVDVGAPLADYAIDVGESVFSAMDKATKQRAVLLTSDGIGALVLTRSGSRRAPVAIDPKRCMAIGIKLSAKERYSDYWVKGQARSHAVRGHAPLDGTAAPLPSRGAEGDATASHARRGVSTTGLDGTAYPLGAGPPIATVSHTRARSIVAGVGHAVDPAVGRYRPRVWVARTGAGGADHQVLAEWRMRIARARAEHRSFTRNDFRAGKDKRLWRINEVVAIAWPGEDPFDMLVEAVTFMQDVQGGSRTELHVVGLEAYDLEPLPDEHRRHRGGPRAAAGSSVNRVR